MSDEVKRYFWMHTGMRENTGSPSPTDYILHSDYAALQKRLHDCQSELGGVEAANKLLREKLAQVEAERDEEKDRANRIQYALEQQFALDHQALVEERDGALSERNWAVGDAEAARAERDAALAKLEAAGKQEPVAWLIELKEGIHPTRWLGGIKPHFPWTTDVFMAVRFPRKEDAEAVNKLFSIYAPTLSSVSVTEHIFEERQAAPPVPQQPAIMVLPENMQHGAIHPFIVDAHNACLAKVRERNPSAECITATELEGLRKDKQRLEWLAESGGMVFDDNDGVAVFWHVSHRSSEAKPTMREAIDAAMAQSSGEQPES